MNARQRRQHRRFVVREFPVGGTVVYRTYFGRRVEGVVVRHPTTTAEIWSLPINTVRLGRPDGKEWVTLDRLRRGLRP